MAGSRIGPVENRKNTEMNGPSTQFPDVVSFTGQIMDLPTDILTPVVVQLCGGAGISDITLWKHACRLAKTCVGFRDAVLNAPILKGIEFRGELVGDHAPEGDDDTKESLLQVNRIRFKPEVAIVLRYGNRAYEMCGTEGTVLSETMLTWRRPLDLDTVLSTFLRPPGWNSAAKLTISGREAPPWRGCFPVDKLPEPERAIPTICTFTGENSKLTVVKNDTVLSTKKESFSFHTFDADALFGNVVAMCSTGIEEFKRGQRAHYLEDLEIGVSAGIPCAVLNNIEIRRALRIDPHEPPDLYYRFKPEEARRLAGYDVSDRQGIYDMMHPPRPKADNKKRWMRLDHENSDEEWDPDVRKRQKEAAREKTRRDMIELNRNESYGVSAEDMLPAHKSRKKQNKEAVVDSSDSAFDSDSDDEPPLPPKPPPRKAVSKPMSSSAVHRSVFGEGPSKAMERMFGYPLNITNYGLNTEWDSKLRTMWKMMRDDSNYGCKDVKTRVQYIQAIAECAQFLKRYPCVHTELGVVNSSSIYEVETLVVSNTLKWRSHCRMRNMKGTDPNQTLDRWYCNIIKMIDLCGPSADADDGEVAWSNIEPDAYQFNEGMPHNEGPSSTGNAEDSDFYDSDSD